MCCRYRRAVLSAVSTRTRHLQPDPDSETGWGVSRRLVKYYLDSARDAGYVLRHNTLIARTVPSWWVGRPPTIFIFSSVDLFRQ